MRRMFKRFYLILIFMIISMTFIVYLQYKFADDAIREEIKAVNELSIEKLRISINHWIADKTRTIEDIAYMIENKPWGEDEILSYLQYTMDRNPSFASMYFGTVDNLMINASGWSPPDDFVLTERPWYVKALKEEDLIITDVFLNASKDDMIIAIAKPVKNESGDIIGVVGGDISIMTIVQLVSSHRVGDGGITFLLSSKGEVLGHPILTQDKELTITVAPDKYIPIINNLIEKSYGIDTFVLNGEKGYLAYATLNNAEWILATFVSYNDVYSSTKELTIIFVLAVLLSFIIFFLFLMLQKKNIINPLLELEENISQIDIEKDLSYRITTKGTNEFAGLTNKINQLLNKIDVYFMEMKDDKLQLKEMNQELEATLEQMLAAEEEIMRQKKYFEALFINSTDGIVLLNKENKIIDINRRFTEIFGYTLDEIKGLELDSILAAEDDQLEANHLTKNLIEGKGVITETIRYSKDSTPMHVSVKGVPIIYENEVVGGYGIYMDISERKKAEEEILHITYHDGLTGLFNRSYFDRALNQIQEEQLPISIIIGDVNGLKMTNDALGHDEGDRLLLKISRIITSVCGEEAIAARIGGDEFAILLPNTKEKQAVDKCKEIKKECDKDSDITVHLSLSLGVATKTTSSESISEIFKLAENRMYDNKLLDSKSTRSSIIASLRKTLQEKTHETEEHSSRLVELGLEVGRKLQLDDNKLNEIRLLATLHDIGKVAIPDHILNKSASLTPEEWKIMKKHSEIGYRIASETAELSNVSESILHHHERWDGGGYPDGLSGEEIPLSARIISVVDAFDAMTSDRPYRKALSTDVAISELMKEKGKQFDPMIVEIFLDIILNKDK